MLDNGDEKERAQSEWADSLAKKQVVPSLQHIIFITDDVELAETMQLELWQEGYQVSVIHDGLRGLLAVQRMKPNLTIVSWSPPRLSGLEICDRLRQVRHEVPVILLTLGDSAQNRIDGLKAGAYDCISVPFVKEELIARIRASLAYRQPVREKTVILRCVDLTLNRNTREVFRGSRAIALTHKEFDLLECLMEHYFQVLTRTQILEKVWGYDYLGSSNIIEVYIRYLRKKLETSRDDRLIHTVRGVGYILREPGSTTS